MSEGFTLSRKGGDFDFLSNCDRPRIELTFGKNPFPYLVKYFNVIPNQVRPLAVLPDVAIYREFGANQNLLLAFLTDFFVTFE